MKSKDHEGAVNHLQELQSEQPDLLLPYQCLAWLRFEKRAYALGFKELIDMVNKVPKLKPGEDSYSAEAIDDFVFAGELREYVSKGLEGQNQAFAEAIANLDAAVSAYGPKAEAAYRQGRDKSAAVAESFDKQIAAAENEADKMILSVKRRLLQRYMAFPYDQAAQRILAGLDSK